MIKNSKKSCVDVLTKGVALFVCATFFVTSIHIPKARAEVAPIPAVSFRSITDDLTAIALPKEIGKIQETFRGSGDKIVILIRDAHSIPDAQQSIRSAIDYFQTKYGISLVGLEGASEKLDPQIFRSFPDKELLRKTFDAYSQRGELTGGTAAALFNTSASAYYGIEDWPLYEDGVSYFLEATAMESEIETLLEPMEAAITREKESVYSGELLEIDRLLADFGRNKTDLVQVLNKLAKYQPPPKGSELAILLEEIRQSQMTDTPVEIEIKKIADQIFSALKNQSLNPEIRQELQEFNGSFQEFRTGRTTPRAFAFYLRGLAKKYGVRVKVSRELAYLTEHQKRLKDIEGTRFFEDFKRYADLVKESLFQNEEQRALDARTRGLDLMKRLARLELSFEDWEKVRKLMLQLDQWTVTQDRVVGREEMSSVLKKMKTHLAFYHVAEKRDKVFLENIRFMMTKTKQESSLLVAGGFHTEGLIRELKEKGISYVLVMPRIGSIPEEPLYREHMQGQVSWSDYFEVKDGKVNLYDAFVRAARDKLLGDKNALATGGKEWRDQIIRDLAAEGRITEAGDYTRFIDELTKQEGGARRAEGDNVQALREKWLANIDRFGEGLRKLHAEGNLSESSIMQLIKTITIPEVSLANQLAPGVRAEVRLLPLIQGPGSSSIARRERPETRRSESREPSAIPGVEDQEPLRVNASLMADILAKRPRNDFKRLNDMFRKIYENARAADGKLRQFDAREVDSRISEYSQEKGLHSMDVRQDGDWHQRGESGFLERVASLQRQPDLQVFRIALVNLQPRQALLDELDKWILDLRKEEGVEGYYKVPAKVSDWGRLNPVTFYFFGSDARPVKVSDNALERLAQIAAEFSLGGEVPQLPGYDRFAKGVFKAVEPGNGDIEKLLNELDQYVEDEVEDPNLKTLGETLSQVLEKIFWDSDLLIYKTSMGKWYAAGEMIDAYKSLVRQNSGSDPESGVAARREARTRSEDAKPSPDSGSGVRAEVRDDARQPKNAAVERQLYTDLLPPGPREEVLNVINLITKDLGVSFPIPVLAVAPQSFGTSAYFHDRNVLLLLPEHFGDLSILGEELIHWLRGFMKKKQKKWWQRKLGDFETGVVDEFFGRLGENYAKAIVKGTPQESLLQGALQRKWSDPEEFQRIIRSIAKEKERIAAAQKRLADLDSLATKRAAVLKHYYENVILPAWKRFISGGIVYREFVEVLEKDLPKISLLLRGFDKITGHPAADVLFYLRTMIEFRDYIRSEEAENYARESEWMKYEMNQLQRAIFELATTGVAGLAVTVMMREGEVYNLGWHLEGYVAAELFIEQNPDWVDRFPEMIRMSDRYVLKRYIATYKVRETVRETIAARTDDMRGSGQVTGSADRREVRTRSEARGGEALQDPAAEASALYRQEDHPAYIFVQAARQAAFDFFAQPNPWNRFMSPIVAIAISMVVILAEMYQLSQIKFFYDASLGAQGVITAGVAFLTVAIYTGIMNLILVSLYRVGSQPLYRGVYGKPDEIIKILEEGDKDPSLGELEINKGIGLWETLGHFAGRRNPKVRSATPQKEWAEHYTRYSAYGQKTSGLKMLGRILREIFGRKFMKAQRYRVAGTAEEVSRIMKDLNTKGIQGSLGLLMTLNPTGRGNKKGNVRMTYWNSLGSHLEAAIVGAIEPEQMEFIEVFIEVIPNRHLGLRAEKLSLEEKMYEIVWNDQNQIMSISRTGPFWRAGTLRPGKGEYEAVVRRLMLQRTIAKERSETRSAGLTVSRTGDAARAEIRSEARAERRAKPDDLRVAQLAPGVTHRVDFLNQKYEFSKSGPNVISPSEEAYLILNGVPFSFSFNKSDPKSDPQITITGPKKRFVLAQGESYTYRDTGTNINIEVTYNSSGLTLKNLSEGSMLSVERDPVDVARKGLVTIRGWAVPRYAARFFHPLSQHQGWKLHVAIDVPDVLTTVPVVRGVLETLKVVFKMETNQEDLKFTNLPLQTNTQRGKGMTVYWFPDDAARMDNMLGGALTRILKENHARKTTVTLIAATSALLLIFSVLAGFAILSAVFGAITFLLAVAMIILHIRRPMDLYDLGAMYLGTLLDRALFDVGVRASPKVRFNPRGIGSDKLFDGASGRIGYRFADDQDDGSVKHRMYYKPKSVDRTLVINAKNMDFREIVRRPGILFERWGLSYRLVSLAESHLAFLKRFEEQASQGRAAGSADRREARTRSEIRSKARMSEAELGVNLDRIRTNPSGFSFKNFNPDRLAKKLLELYNYEGPSEPLLIRKYVLAAAKKAADSMEENREESTVLGISGEVSGLYELVVNRGGVLRNLESGRLEEVNPVVYNGRKELDARTWNTVLESKFHGGLLDVIMQVMGGDRNRLSHLQAIVDDPELSHIRNLVFFAENDGGYMGKAVLAYLKSLRGPGEPELVMTEKGFSLKLRLEKVTDFLFNDKVWEVIEQEAGKHNRKLNQKRVENEINRWVRLKRKDLGPGEHFDVIISVSNAYSDEIAAMTELAGRSKTGKASPARSEARKTAEVPARTVNVEDRFPHMYYEKLFPAWATAELLANNPALEAFLKSQEQELAKIKRVRNEEQRRILSWKYLGTPAEQQDALNRSLRSLDASTHAQIMKIRTAIDVFRRTMTRSKTGSMPKYEVAEVNEGDPEIVRLRDDFGRGNALHMFGAAAYMGGDYKMLALRERNGPVLSFLTYKQLAKDHYELGLIFTAPEARGRRAGEHLFYQWLTKLTKVHKGDLRLETSELSEGPGGGEAFFRKLQKPMFLGSKAVQLKQRTRPWERLRVAKDDFLSGSDIAEIDEWEKSEEKLIPFIVGLIDLAKVDPARLARLVDETGETVARSEARMEAHEVTIEAGFKFSTTANINRKDLTQLAELQGHKGLRINSDGTLKFGDWRIFETSLKEVSDSFNQAGIDFVEDIMAKASAAKAEGKEGKIKIVDWGCGNARALMELDKTLKEKGLRDAVELIGFADMIAPEWKEASKLGIRLILDPSDNFSKHFEAGSIDILFSYSALHHLANQASYEPYTNYLKSLRPLLSPEGYLIHNRFGNRIAGPNYSVDDKKAIQDNLSKNYRVETWGDVLFLALPTGKAKPVEVQVLPGQAVPARSGQQGLRRAEVRVRGETAAQVAAGALDPSMPKGEMSPEQAGELVRAVKEMGIDKFVEQMMADAISKIESAAESQSRQPGSPVRVTDQMARDFIERISDGLRDFLRASDLKGNMTAVFDRAPDKNFLEALRAVRFGLETVVFPGDKAQRLNRNDLEGLIVQTVRSLATFNPVAAENRGAIPVISEDIGASYFENNPNLFGVGLDDDGSITGETFLEIAEHVTRIAAGIVYTRLKMEGKAPSPAEINAELCKLLFQLDAVARDEAVFSMNGRHLIVHRSALLAALQRTYQAQASIQKAA